MRKLLVLFFILIQYVLSAQQLYFDFETDTLTGWEELNASRWTADSVRPLSGDKSLHHTFDNSESGIDVIAFQHEQLFFDSAKTVWKFKVMYDYNPSSGNNWAVWIASDRGVGEMTKQGNAKGYIVGVNYTGSDDFLKVWKQEEGKVTTIYNSGFNWQDSVPPGEAREIQIERTTAGEWYLKIGKVDEGKWYEPDMFEERSIFYSAYLGVYYKYTSSQDQKLWIDDVGIEGSFYTDIYPPVLESFEIVERNELFVRFSEAVDTNKPVSFEMNSGIKPQTIQWLNSTELRLFFHDYFENINSVSITGIEDLKGNESEVISFNFNYYNPQVYDLVITEVLADPTDTVGLPETEFIEVLNRSGRMLNLSGWKLEVGEKSVNMPDRDIYPGQYYILTKSSKRWSRFGMDSLIIELSGMPALTNEGNLLKIYERYGRFICGVEYSNEMYKTEYKQEGGWTLEMVDVTVPCLKDGNWEESVSRTGGTPGRENSVRSVILDENRPEVLKVLSLNNSQLSVLFSKSMDSLLLANPDDYSISDGNDVVRVAVQPPFFDKAVLDLSGTLEEGKVYTVLFQGDIADCSGNLLEKQEFSFGLAVIPDSAELIINEILFDGTDEVPEFVELFNNSDDILELGNLSLAIMDELSGEYKNERLLTKESFQLLPGDYVVFTEDKDLLVQAFPECEKRKVVETSSRLSLNNDGGSLALKNIAGESIDMAKFDPQMHFSLLDDKKGVSLERLSFGSPGTMESSWHSAASDVGYATPARPNSQMLKENNGSHEINITPKEISPDNDGVNDIIQIQYAFSKPGYQVTIRIYSTDGVLVKNVANNELCGTSGSFIWTGLNEDEGKLPLGYYIVLTECVHPEGDVIKDKKTILVLP